MRLPRTVWKLLTPAATDTRPAQVSKIILSEHHYRKLHVSFILLFCSLTTGRQCRAVDNMLWTEMPSLHHSISIACLTPLLSANEAETQFPHFAYIVRRVYQSAWIWQCTEQITHYNWPDQKLWKLLYFTCYTDHNTMRIAQCRRWTAGFEGSMS